MMVISMFLGKSTHLDNIMKQPLTFENPLASPDSKVE
jgi:hypothetical protein